VPHTLARNTTHIRASYYVSRGPQWGCIQNPPSFHSQITQTSFVYRRVPAYTNLRQLMHSLTTFILVNFDIEVNDLIDHLPVSSNLVRFEFASSGRLDHEALLKCMRWKQ
jgi:hypothetical protein